MKVKFSKETWEHIEKVYYDTLGNYSLQRDASVDDFMRLLSMQEITIVGVSIDYAGRVAYND